MGLCRLFPGATHGYAPSVRMAYIHAPICIRRMPSIESASNELGGKMRPRVLAILLVVGAAALLIAGCGTQAAGVTPGVTPTRTVGAGTPAVTGTAPGAAGTARPTGEVTGTPGATVTETVTGTVTVTHTPTPAHTPTGTPTTSG